MRGGAACDCAEHVLPLGRSPRARGSPLGHQVHDRRPGSIPACAGEPVFDRRSVHLASVDPRVRGGACARSACKSATQGRSPRARGSPRASSGCLGTRRSIPACAGEPRLAANVGYRFEVDPRVRGGAFPFHVVPSLFLGRSPRARGSRDALPQAWRRGGSIPACAGEPHPGQRRAALRGVDPRVRGGAPNGRYAGQIPTGRSPRARGSRVLEDFQAEDIRSIPACAGEPERLEEAKWTLRVDPRVRGGASSASMMRMRAMGRSPRARGSLRHFLGALIYKGSIPACAGEPLGRNAPGVFLGVDPRVRGGASPIGGVPVWRASATF